MLYWLFYPLKNEISFFRIFGYVTFRTVAAALTALIIMYFIGPPFIRILRRMKYGESIRDDGPSSHASKAGTPTMGGILIMVSMAASVLLWGNLSNHYVLCLLLGTLALSIIGFKDDYMKSIQKISGGMRPKKKLIFQFSVAIIFSIIVYTKPYTDPSFKSSAVLLYFPFLKDPIFYLGVLALPFWVFIVVGSSNAVNLTDGLDGLAIGISSIVTATLAIFAYVSGLEGVANYLRIAFIPEANEITVFLAALTGASMGFLWHNSHPAEIFMGDTGSLAIGGAIGMSVICIRKEILLVILGGAFVMEAVSVILQVGFFKWKGRRIFKMAPIHHHFELMGWHENKVVIRFWLLGILLALIALSSLKIN